MEWSFKVVNIATGICLATLSGMVYADGSALNPVLPTAASFYTNNFQSLKSQSINSQSVKSTAYLLATNEDDALLGQEGPTTVTPATEFKPPWMSGRKAHQYLGLGT